MSRRHLDIPGSLRVDGRGPEHYTLAHIHIGARLEVTYTECYQQYHQVVFHQVFGRQFSISGCDESVRRYLADSEVRYLQYLYIYNIYNIYNIYISAQVHLPAVCRDSIENFFASGAAEAGTEQPHVKVPVA